METQEVTYKVKLVAHNIDSMNYTTFVFEDLEYTNPDYKYLCCVMFPNWNQGIISINDIGYVTVRYVREGIDKWFDGQNFNTYRYTNVIFLKFIHEKSEVNIEEIVVD